MSAKPTPFIAGNWKMNGGPGEARALAGAIGARAKAALPPGVEVAVFPPALWLGLVRDALDGAPTALGGQDCHAEPKGAHTGDMSAEMLAAAGCAYIIVGHSERRADHGEGDTDVCAKARATHRAGLATIICVGESADERAAGTTIEVITRQLEGSLPEAGGAANTVIAYEPVWAIGSGLTPTAVEIEAVHAHVRERIEARWGAEAGRVRILYGGSVNAGNARDILAIANVDGALVGGASLIAEDFWAIVEAAAPVANAG